MKPILNTAEAAELLGCEPSTARELARTGTIPGVKFGHDWVFPLEALIESVNTAAHAHARFKRLSGGGTPPPAAAAASQWGGGPVKLPVNLDTFVAQGKPQ